jgi:molybdopterin synthase catalytic subunit
MVSVFITKEVIIPNNIKVDHNEIGSKLNFSGCVREMEKNESIKGIDYEYYEDMAEKELLKLGEKALNKFKLSSFSCVHRVGFIPVRDVVVYVEIQSSHRIESFEAMAWFMSKLKQDVPIWKNVLNDNGK